MMGSLEEEILVKMVDEFIESAAETPSSCSSNSLPLSSKRSQYYLFSLKEILGSGSKAEREVGEIVKKHVRRKRKDGDPKSSNLKKWVVMKLKREGYDCCGLCHTSWVTSMGCPAGDYEYIEMGSGEKRLIIDVEFKAQFEIARATEAYKQLTEALPWVFVGSEERVLRIISLLCSAAKQSLKDSGLHLPPWRTYTYMHCKWLCLSHNHNHNHMPQNNNNLEPLINQHQNENESGNLITQWKPKRVLWGAASALSTQFSNMSINCC